MAYESIHPSSPFRQRVAEAIPEVLKPLRYCAFRTGTEGGMCDTFACAEVLEMAFCYQHAKVILHELQNEGSPE